MNKDELLKIYSAFLPYKLEVWYTPLSSVHILKRIEVRNYDDHLIEISNNIIIKESISSEYVKPIFRDLSYLTKEIEHDGKIIIPLYELQRDDKAFTIDFIDTFGYEELKVSVYEKLLEWHFNVFQLPEGQFINKATLTNK